MGNSRERNRHRTEIIQKTIYTLMVTELWEWGYAGLLEPKWLHYVSRGQAWRSSKIWSFLCWALEWFIIASLVLVFTVVICFFFVTVSVTVFSLPGIGMIFTLGHYSWTYVTCSLFYKSLWPYHWKIVIFVIYINWYGKSYSGGRGFEQFLGSTTWIIKRTNCTYAFSVLFFWLNIMWLAPNASRLDFLAMKDCTLNCELK